MKKAIGIDVDAVLADSDPIFIKGLSALTGRELVRRVDSPFKYEDAFGISDDLMETFWKDFTDNEKWLDIPVISGAVETVEMLRMDHRIFIVSARPPSVTEQTMKWLEKNSLHFDEIVLTDFRDKYEAVSHIGNLEFFIEDNPDFAIRFAQNNVKVILFDYSWNRELKGKNIFRVGGWKDAQKILFNSSFIR